MTKEQYQMITETTARCVQKMPGKEKILKLPTYVCAAIYLAMLGWLAWNRDARLIRAAAVPAVCFGVVTVLRPIIHRQRPYDRFDLPPVGKWKRGKGKSMPSRHTASAVAIAAAVIAVFPNPAVCVLMSLLGLTIAALRVLAGQHYPSDVATAIALSVLLSWLGFSI